MPADVSCHTNKKNTIFFHQVQSVNLM